MEISPRQQHLNLAALACVRLVIRESLPLRLQKYETMQLRASLADRPPYRKFLILVGLTLIFAVLLTGIGAGLAKSIYGVDIMNDPSVYDKGTQPGIVAAFRLLQSLAAIGTFILPSFLAAFLFSSNSRQYLGLQNKAHFPSVLMVFLVLLIGIPFINWMSFINQGLHLPASLKGIEDWMKTSEEQASRITGILLGTGTALDLISNLFVIALLPAIGEELFFRGIVQKQYEELSRNRTAAIVLTAFLFSALHMQFFGFIPRLMLGIFLGYLYVWSHSLWLPILAHFINNAGAVILTWLFTRNNTQLNPDTIGLEPGQEVLLGISVFMSLAGIWFLKKNLTPKVQ